MTKLILHIGLGKTGTTALQSWLTRHRGLAAHGIVHAGLELERLPGRFRLAGQGAVGDPAQLAEGLAKIEAAAARPEIGTIVWSNESLGMSHAAPAILAALNAHLCGPTRLEGVEVVLVLRRQDEWIESAYRQWGLRHKTRRGFGAPTPRQYLSGVRRLLDYRALHAAWAGLGGARLRLVSYDDVTAAGGIAPWFSRELLGLDPAEGPQDGARVHVSPGPALAYFHGLYNGGFEGEVTPDAFGRVLDAHDLPELAPKTAAFFGKAIRREILARYGPENDALAQEALGRPHLFRPRPVAEVTRYEDGPTHALTYLAMIAARQQALLEGRGT